MGEQKLQIPQGKASSRKEEIRREKTVLKEKKSKK